VVAEGGHDSHIRRSIYYIWDQVVRFEGKNHTVSHFVSTYRPSIIRQGHLGSGRRCVARDVVVVLLRAHLPEREFFIDNLLVRIHFIIVMIWWTGLAPWEFAPTCHARIVSSVSSAYTVQGYLAHKKLPPP